MATVTTIPGGSKAPARKTATPAGATIEITFEIERETKGTYRYAETGEPEGHRIGTLYVRKTAFKGAAAPETLRVRIVLA